MKALLFDSHAHYYDTRFEEETENGAYAILDSVFDQNAGGVGRIINVGTNNENNEICLMMASRYEGMYAAVGIHPGDCRDYSFDEIERFREFIASHSDFRSEKIVAIGEIGLDYHYEPFDKEKQRFFFEEQMKIAEESGLPVIIHDREAHGDCFDVACKYKNVGGVFHSYSGSSEMAVELVRRGWYISFSGVVTFKNANRVREVVKSVPLDRILVETDCPYLAPHPMRGKINHSGYLHYTVDAIADALGIDFDTVARATWDNASRLFGI